MGKHTKAKGRLTIGLDLGDQHIQCCVLDAGGSIVEEGRMRTTPEAVKCRFENQTPSRIALEVGTHSTWVSRLLEDCGHEVLVANPRKLRLIYQNDQKTDKVDAQYLARVARVDPKLLSPIEHRSEETQKDLAVIRSRDALVQTRTKLINHVRGSVKSMGHRLPSCSAESFATKAEGALPDDLKPALGPVLEVIRTLTQQIRRYDTWIDTVAQERYPETAVMREVAGVGSLTSLAYALTLENPARFPKSRQVGAYLGLRPKRSQSGKQDPELRISKTGDSYLRRLLVGSAQYILGPFGPDSDLRRWGSKLAERGGKSAKKRAVVAVARKLAVLLHRLWSTQEPYEALRNQHGGRGAPPPAAPPLASLA